MNETKEVSSSELKAQVDADVQSKDDKQSDTAPKRKAEDQAKSREIARQVSRGNINTLNLFNSDELASAEAFLTKVMRSDKGGIKSVSDGLAILMRAKDLALPFSTCIEHIHVINGKTGIDIHIVKALLSRAGCTWETIKDYQPLYEYTDGINVYVDGSLPDYVQRCISQAEAEKKIAESTDADTYYAYPVKWYQDVNGNVYKDYQLNAAQFKIAINKAQMADIVKAGKIPVYRIPNKPVDFITEYEITRTLNGKEISARGRFTYNEAVVAQMFEKDTYKKYARILIGHRAFTYVAREIASDVLFGVSETTELKIVSGVELNGSDFNSVEDAEVISID